MTSCFFTDLENIATSQLMEAQSSVHAAVAWINFNYYGSILETLLDQGVKIKILLNNDAINQRYISYIEKLNNYGAKIKLVSFPGIMHHKFCVIDKKICMFGSFNWTQNANLRNTEDLNICDESQFVNAYLLEFKALWKLSKEDIQLLTHPIHCKYCNEPVINILLMEQEGDYQTRIDVLQQCGCKQIIVYSDYYDISVYNNYVALSQRYDDILDMYKNGDEDAYHQLLSEQNYEVAKYLSFVRNQRMGRRIIHAIGVKTWQYYCKDDGEYVYKIIWKERGTDSYIQDEYSVLS